MDVQPNELSESLSRAPGDASARPGAARTPTHIRNLPPASATSLFGAEPLQATLREALADEAGRWRIALVGPGGIGKATLARVCAARLADQPGSHFQGIVWDTLQPQAAAGQRANLLAHPLSTFDSLLEAIALQLGYDEQVKVEAPKKEAFLRALLKSVPYLIVVDNLDAASDGASLISALQTLANPTKFLLTSRQRLPDAEGVWPITVAPLGDADALALLRHLAAERGLTELAASSDSDLLALQRVCGGNPLALQLMGNLTAHRPLRQVMQELTPTSPVTENDFRRRI